MKEVDTGGRERPQETGRATKKEKFPLRGSWCFFRLFMSEQFPNWFVCDLRVSKLQRVWCGPLAYAAGWYASLRSANGYTRLSELGEPGDCYCGYGDIAEFVCFGREVFG